MKKKDPRHRGREAALQILYQSDIGRTTPQQATETFFSAQWPDEEPASAELQRFAWQLVSETVEHRDRIEALIAETALRWRPERMPIVDRLILQLAICELLFRPNTPPAVVINEALELARTFSTEDAVKFINGMLDAIRRRIDAGAPGATDAKDTTE